jgi:hypothetical protein
MTRRQNTNNLGQYFVLDIRHTIYGSIIGMWLCWFSHNKLKNYVCLFQLCVSYILFSHTTGSDVTGSDVTGSDVIFPALFSYYSSSTFWYGKYGWKVSWIVKIYGKYGSKVSWIVKWYGKYGWKVSIWKIWK